MTEKTKAFLTRAASAAVLFAVCAALMTGLLLPGGKKSEGKIAPAPFIPSGDDSAPIFEREKREPTVTEDEARSEVNVREDGSVRGVVDTASLSLYGLSLPFAGNLSGEGYGTTDLPYDPATMKIAVMTPNFDVPDAFSLRKKTVSESTPTQSVMYGEFEPLYTEKEVDRPALDVYMGYIVLDEGDILTLYSAAGDRLLSFDDTEYVPAYERDRNGAPLFVRPTTVNSGMFDCEGLEIKIYKKDAAPDPDKEEEKDRPNDPEHGDERIRLARVPLEKEKTVYVKAKLLEEGQGNPVREESNAYYTLSYDGSYFAYSGFSEFTDSRGARFDYPSYYGLSDGGGTLSVKLYDLYRQNKDGVLSILHKGFWTYTVWGNPISEDRFERAYNFSEGLGCVLTEPYYEGGGLAFVDGSGRRAFPIRTEKRDNTGRIILETFMGPVDPNDSVGYFYYDHGLVRVRLESIDGNNFLYDSRKRYLGTKEILIDKKGRQFPIPEGYEIRAYSDGVILLEKDGKFGYMDYTGAWIAEPVYAAARPFSEGLGVLTTADGKTGVIDSTGAIVVPFRYSFISECSDGVMTAYSEEDGWRLLRKMTVS